MKWIEALKHYNAGKKMYCIPKKGTPEHAEVLAIMGGAKPEEHKEEHKEEMPAPAEAPKRGRGRPRKGFYVAEAGKVYKDGVKIRGGVRGRPKGTTGIPRVSLVALAKESVKQGYLTKEEALGKPVKTEKAAVAVKQRKVRSDKGKKRGPSVAGRMAAGGKAYEAMMDVD
jgi:hypothetical protein